MTYLHDFVSGAVQGSGSRLVCRGVWKILTLPQVPLDQSAKRGRELDEIFGGKNPAQNQNAET